MDSGTIREATVALDAVGFTCHSHSYGELATTWILDAIAEARAVNDGGRGRHHIAHLMVISEEDFPRFAELDVTANIQAAWGSSAVIHDIMHLTTGSDDPQLREYAFGRLAAAGARLAAGSDWPVTTADPLAVIRLEVTRGRDRKPTGADGDPDELDRLDLPTLLTAYTAGSAYVNRSGAERRSDRCRLRSRPRPPRPRPVPGRRLTPTGHCGPDMDRGRARVRPRDSRSTRRNRSAAVRVSARTN